MTKDPGSGETKGPTVDYPSLTVTHVTVKGREVFDDWRHYGRLNLRYDSDGVAGKDRNTTGNLLGVYDATVNVYEIDEGFDENEPDCVTTHLIGSTKVDAHGNWSLPLASFTDGCGSDVEPELMISLRTEVVLTYCDDLRCFSVRLESVGVKNENLAPYGSPPTRTWVPRRSRRTASRSATSPPTISTFRVRPNPPTTRRST